MDASHELVSADSQNISYEQMRPEHIEQAAQLCLEQNWNVDCKLIRGYYEDYPSGCVIALKDSQVIGFCCSSVLNDEHAFICYFLVKKEHRGKGIGGNLLSKAVEELGDKNVYVYSTPDGVNIYKNKGGFKGSDPPATFYASRFVPKIPDKEDPAADVEIQHICENNLDELAEHDKTIHVIERSKLIAQYIRENDYGIFARNSQGHMCGYSFVEKKPLATKVTPLYADTASVARKLLQYIVNKLPENEKIQVFFPDDNKEAVDFFLGAGFSFDNCLRCELLWTKTRFEVPLDKVYSMMNLCNVFA